MHDSKSNPRLDYYGGAFMFLLGVGAAYQGSTYSIGSLSRMGPGFFPTALGVILAVVGAAIFVAAFMSSDPVSKEKTLPPEWRGWICICGSIVAFVVLGRFGGLVPATFAIVFISALGDRDNSVIAAIILALAVVVVAIVVFWWALQMNFPLFRWS